VSGIALRRKCDFENGLPEIHLCRCYLSISSCDEGEILPPEDELVSVVIPFFNRTALLTRALKSVIDQTHENLEIIVVDDGSTEDASKNLSTIQDERIRLLRHDRNRGVSAARNTGIKAARGEYISFLDSDDEWLPAKTEKQLAQLRKTGDKGLVSYCLSEVFSDVEGKVTNLHDFSQEGDLLHHALRSSVRMSAGSGLCILMNEIMMTKEQMLSVGGFNESYRMHEDWEFLIRLAKWYRFICMKEFLVRNHKHDQGHIANDYSMVPEVRYRMMEEHRELFLKDDDARAFFYSELAYYEGLNGDKGRAVLSLAKCAACRPLRRDPYIKLGLLLTNRLEPPRTDL
jgi:glycosyltransferase involved in cell wall biosynthesis